MAKSKQEYAEELRQAQENLNSLNKDAISRFHKISLLEARDIKNETRRLQFTIKRIKDILTKL